MKPGCVCDGEGCMACRAQEPLKADAPKADTVPKVGDVVEYQGQSYRVADVMPRLRSGSDGRGQCRTDGYTVGLVRESQPDVQINGVQLDSAQVEALRVALTGQLSMMSEPNALGGDETGRELARLYRERTSEVLTLLRSRER